MLLKIFILSRNDGIFDIVRNRITLNRCSQQVSVNIRNLLGIGIAHRRYQTNLVNLIQQGFILNRRNRLNLTPQITQTNSCTEQGKDDNNHIKEIRQKL